LVAWCRERFFNNVSNSLYVSLTTDFWFSTYSFFFEKKLWSKSSPAKHQIY
jgi:hypothetical protein